MITHLLQALSAFGAGVGTSLSPCVYPLLPITVGFIGTAGADKSYAHKRVFSFFLGQVISFTLLGVAAVLVGEILGFSSEIPAVQIATGVLLLLFSYASFFNKLPGFLNRLSSLAPNHANTLFGAFLVGASSAAIASPCTTPVVGGLLAAISQVQERLWGISLMFFFALGLSFLFLVVGLGLTRLRNLPRAGSWMTFIHKLSSLILALGGVYFIYKGLHVT